LRRRRHAASRHFSQFGTRGFKSRVFFSGGAQSRRALYRRHACFNHRRFVRLAGGGPIPLYGYLAMAGGILISLLLGGGLTALVFYSSRHGYDDDANRFDETK
jgi:hypothetical protein